MRGGDLNLLPEKSGMRGKTNRGAPFLIEVLSCVQFLLARLRRASKPTNSYVVTYVSGQKLRAFLIGVSTFEFWASTPL